MTGTPLLVGEPNTLTWSEAAMMGFVAGLLVSTDRATLSVASLDAWLRVPIRLGQILLMFGERGTPLAYASWAYVTPETAARLGRGAAPAPEDWNDGTLLWIVDIVAPHGNARALIAALRTGPAASRDTVAFASRHGNALPRTMRIRPV